MNYAYLLEAGMLVCFGFSWPLNVIKAYKARTAKGTSLAFIILIITGYVFGITAKLINRQFNYVLGVYLLNLAIVMSNVFVYIRNKSLDKKAAKATTKVTKLNIEDIVETKEETMLNYSNSLDYLINRPAKAVEKKNGVILMGGTMDKAIPVSQLSKDFGFNFDLYNKSESGLSLANAGEYFNSTVAELKPEGIMFHLGEEDLALFQNNSSAFDLYYLNLVDSVKAINKNCRVALISVSNPEGNKVISQMNAHIKAIADAEKAAYVNIENAKLWKPEATKASLNFAYSMGLNVRKPLRDVAEVLYSYAYHNIEAKEAETMLA